MGEQLSPALVERLRAWPASLGRGDALSSTFMTELLGGAADRIEQLEACSAASPLREEMVEDRARARQLLADVLAVPVEDAAFTADGIFDFDRAVQLLTLGYARERALLAACLESLGDMMMFRRFSTTPEQREKVDRAIALHRRLSAMLPREDARQCLALIPSGAEAFQEGATGEREALVGRVLDYAKSLGLGTPESRAVVTAIEHAQCYPLSAAAPKAPASPLAEGPDFLEAAEEAADLLEQYAAFIRTVKADDLEMHPYLPQVEDTAEYLRKALSSSPITGKDGE